MVEDSRNSHRVVWTILQPLDAILRFIVFCNDALSDPRMARVNSVIGLSPYHLLLINIGNTTSNRTVLLLGLFTYS